MSEPRRSHLGELSRPEKNNFSEISKYQPILESFLKHLKFERNFSQNSVKAYQSDLKNYLDYLSHQSLNLFQIQHQQILEYLWIRKDKGLKTTTIYRELESIKMFHKFLFLEEHSKTDPGTKLISPKIVHKLPRFLSQREVEKLISAVPADKEIVIRFRAMLEVMYAAGLRVSELLNLKVSQVDLDSGFLQVMGKGMKERIVPIGQSARNAVRKYLQARAEKFRNRKADQEILFLSKFGRSMSRVAFWMQLKKFVKIAGISKFVSPHTLRHSFASHMLAGGADLRALQELLGHSSLATTQIYTHIETRHLKDMHRKFHPRG